jgi:hypothetical protein
MLSSPGCEATTLKASAGTGAPASFGAAGVAAGDCGEREPRQAKPANTTSIARQAAAASATAFRPDRRAICAGAAESASGSLMAA